MSRTTLFILLRRTLIFNGSRNILIRDYCGEETTRYNFLRREPKKDQTLGNTNLALPPTLVLNFYRSCTRPEIEESSAKNDIAMHSTLDFQTWS